MPSKARIFQVLVMIYDAPRSKNWENLFVAASLCFFRSQHIRGCRCLHSNEIRKLEQAQRCKRSLYPSHMCHWHQQHCFCLWCHYWHHHQKQPQRLWTLLTLYQMHFRPDDGIADSRFCYPPSKPTLKHSWVGNYQKNMCSLMSVIVTTEQQKLGSRLFFVNRVSLTIFLYT